MLIKKVIRAKTTQYKQEQFIYHFRRKNTRFFTAKKGQLNSLELSIAEEAVESCER